MFIPVTLLLLVSSLAGANPLPRRLGRGRKVPQNHLIAAGGGKCSGGVNGATVSLLKSLEGFVASPKPDPVGFPTVGYGHLCKTKGCKEVRFKFPLTQATATQLFQTNIKPFYACVQSSIGKNVVLNDNQVGALTSYAYNVGCGGFKKSGVARRLNAGENPNTVVAQEFPKAVMARGKPILKKRRARELKLFQTPSSVRAHPC